MSPVIMKNETACDKYEAEVGIKFCTDYGYHGIHNKVRRVFDKSPCYVQVVNYLDEEILVGSSSPLTEEQILHWKSLMDDENY